MIFWSRTRSSGAVCAPWGRRGVTRRTAPPEGPDDAEEGAGEGEGRRTCRRADTGGAACSGARRRALVRPVEHAARLHRRVRPQLRARRDGRRRHLRRRHARPERRVRVPDGGRCRAEAARRDRDRVRGQSGSEPSGPHQGHPGKRRRSERRARGRRAAGFERHVGDSAGQLPRPHRHGRRGAARDGRAARGSVGMGAAARFRPRGHRGHRSGQSATPLPPTHHFHMLPSNQADAAWILRRTRRRR